ncbi:MULTISPECIES: DUF928 domain-containing protein [unclassified Microcoleus]|uniref:DUF928 domain-containing protein n=1 Tax=unclassified Microcoleus TaxID=2642155 RepID=UPI002FD5E5B0
MNKFRLKSLAFCAILLIGSFNACQFASLAQDLPIGVQGKPPTQPGGPRFSQPPEDIDVSRRAPRNNVRGGCASNPQQTLTGLVPQNKVGRTVSDYPTFFFYLPPTEAESAEFSLVDKSGKEIYKQTLTISNLSGVIGISIPANKNVAPLEVGKSYNWNFTVICNSQDRSSDMIEIGTVRRVELSADIRSELSKADSRQKTAIYAENGIWQDALSNLVATRRAQPSDTVLYADWANFLDAVNLLKIAKEPIVQVQTEPKP